VVNEESVMHDGQIYALTVENTVTKKKIIFKCSYKFFPKKLADVASLLNGKGKLEINFSEINETNFLDEKIKTLVSQYCQRDVLILSQLITKIDKSLKELCPN